MTDAFLGYLQKERDRLAEALAKARSMAEPDQMEIVRLRKQALIIENQMVRWASDLAQTAA